MILVFFYRFFYKFANVSFFYQSVFQGWDQGNNGGSVIIFLFATLVCKVRKVMSNIIYSSKLNQNLENFVFTVFVMDICEAFDKQSHFVKSPRSLHSSHHLF